MSLRVAGGYGVLVLAVGVWSVVVVAGQPVVQQYPRVYAINYNPWLESRNQRLHQYAGWNNPASNNLLYAGDLATSSHGLMNYRVTAQIDADEWPLKSDGFRYTDASYLACLATWSGWHTPDGVDYKAIARDYDLARRVDLGEIDEVFVQGAPYFGYWESTMAGLGGYWCNSGPQQRITSSRIFIMMGFNYERYIGEMLEDYGHRSESILWHTYGSWQPVATHAWNRFTLYDRIAPGNAACGNVHYAPNSLSDYDWGNTRYVWSTCEDWLNNYPNLTGQRIWVNCTEWGCEIRAHHNWWFAHFPHVAGSLTEYGMTRLNTWWEYTQNFNAHPESGGDHAPGGTPPGSVPFGGSVRRITDNAADDWRPQVNIHGRVVWSGYDAAARRWRIYAADADGTGLALLGTGAAGAELPRINAAGQVVWQQFDGRDWEIYTASSDGTGVRQITSDAFQSWHADINDAGRIVWDQFDGEDYEIYSANVDGSDVVRITSNTHGGSGKPRDDVWPRINASGRVVWMGWSGSNWEIYSANADGTGLVNVSTNVYEDEYPQINSAGRVVWQAWASDSNCDIWVANATGGGMLKITNTSTLNWWPQINAAGEIVWMQRAGKWQIRQRHANGSVTGLTSGTTNNGYPVIDDAGRVAWQSFDAEHWQIYLREGGTTYKVTTGAYDSRAPALAAGAALVWHGEAAGDPNDPNYRGQTSEIFATGPANALIGDLNCDGLVDFNDINPFVLVLSDPNAWQAQYPGCPPSNGDANGDGRVDFGDINPFVALLAR
ncbi:MAG: hypothetical protein AB1716_17370 [Planctomycetota bacterium]